MRLVVCIRFAVLRIPAGDVLHSLRAPCPTPTPVFTRKITTDGREMRPTKVSPRLVAVFREGSRVAAVWLQFFPNAGKDWGSAAST